MQTQVLNELGGSEEIIISYFADDTYITYNKNNKLAWETTSLTSPHQFKLNYELRMLLLLK